MAKHFNFKYIKIDIFYWNRFLRFAKISRFFHKKQIFLEDSGSAEEDVGEI